MFKKTFLRDNICIWDAAASLFYTQNTFKYQSKMNVLLTLNNGYVIKTIL